MFNYLSLLPPEQQPAFSDFVSTIATANLFRDAFRADVAIQTQAVFITNDRLSQTYHYKHAGADKVASLLITYKPGLIMCGVA